MAITRIRLLTIPIEILPDEDIEQPRLDMAGKGEPQQIVFITIWDLLRARRDCIQCSGFRA